MEGAVPSFQAHSCSSDGKLSNGAKIKKTPTIVYLPHLRNNTHCAIIIAFAMGGVVAMETGCLWIIFGVYRIQILPLLDPRVYLLVIRMVSKHYACTLL